MPKELELWQFISGRLKQGQSVMLLVVAESTGSSPGRQGYKMSIAADGELAGSIGGGVMEVRLVEQSRDILAERRQTAAGVVEQVHQKNALNASGMICSGKQTVIFKLLDRQDAESVENIINSLARGGRDILNISPLEINVEPPGNAGDVRDLSFEKVSESEYEYREKLGPSNDLYIIGGGHCALALSELMSKMDFYVRIFDDRPELNTLHKNRFADEITIIDDYKSIGTMVQPGQGSYVVVMTVGYASDAVVIRSLIGKDLKYFGVLGSGAKMATLMKELKTEGFNVDDLAKIHTPIGIKINSRTPEEIAVSIAAEIIAVKNA